VLEREGGGEVDQFAVMMELSRTREARAVSGMARVSAWWIREENMEVFRV